MDSPVELVSREQAVVRSELGLPDGSEVVLVDEGWDSRVYLVDGGRAVFKFPRSPHIRARYGHEISVLRMLEPLALPVPTPRVRWPAADGAWFGYEGIVGQPLSEVPGTIPDHTRAAIGTALGRFLTEFHALELTGAEVVSVADEVRQFQGRYGEAAPAIADRCSVADRRALDRFFGETLPGELHRLGGDPCLCHSDLGPYNIIFTGDATPGVIDFGDTRWFDRSKDFMGLSGPMLDAALDAYGDSDLLRAKVAVRVKALPALDVPHYQATGNQARVDQCIERLRAGLLG